MALCTLTTKALLYNVQTVAFCTHTTMTLCTLTINALLYNVHKLSLCTLTTVALMYNLHTVALSTLPTGALYGGHSTSSGVLPPIVRPVKMAPFLGPEGGSGV